MSPAFLQPRRHLRRRGAPPRTNAECSPRAAHRPRAGVRVCVPTSDSVLAPMLAPSHVEPRLISHADDAVVIPSVPAHQPAPSILHRNRLVPSEPQATPLPHTLATQWMRTGNVEHPRQPEGRVEELRRLDGRAV
eukprot:197140-Prymnesium_polylepis.1